MIHVGSIFANILSAISLCHLLIAVYIIYIYFKNICNFIWLYKNKLYICTSNKAKY